VKFITIIFLGVVCLFPSAIAGQLQDNDPYSVELVRVALKNQGHGLIIAKTQTYLARMGDAASIAILKVLSEAELYDPHTVTTFLPMIRQAFSEPRFITISIDKQPTVTLFLLKNVEQRVEDARLRKQIEETIQNVKVKASE
jgi:hypothetical protein